MRWCEHGPACHDGSGSSAGTAPDGWRAWLLLEHNGPWPPDPLDADLGHREREAVREAEALGIRVQLIRRPGRSRLARRGEEHVVFACWSGGAHPWLRRWTRDSLATLDLAALAAGTAPPLGTPVAGPQFLVCTHARRDLCCARFGLPLARDLARERPGQVWETTHVGGHRYAANLVILPDALYYGPVDTPSATAAITAYLRGQVSPDRYRGRVSGRA